ncbi:MAG: DUF1080 domain-containing protein [Planctomycetota bacterium]
MPTKNRRCRTSPRWPLFHLPLLAGLAIAIGPLAGCSTAPSAAPPEANSAATPEANSETSTPAAESAQAPPTKFQSPLSADELAEGWISLFDGTSLFGWHAATKADWQVVDGAIRVADGEPGLLCTPVQFSNYLLQLDFRFAPGTNSGVFLHSPHKPLDPKSDCYELNIAEPAVSPFPTGSLVGRAKAEATAAPGTWHHYDITVLGERIKIELNGQTVLEYTDERPLGRGYIGLQLNKGQVEFRNLKLKPLALQPLFNGQDLAGWKTYPEMKSEFTVQDGTMHVRGGKGQLESEKSFGDFVLQLEAITHASGLNSGLFFRCIPGLEMQGYESQIHHGVKAGDRTKPADCGTGGIFRRRDARLVAADDGEWFTKTIIADGPQIAVWVNGVWVTDWLDDRAADENPRRGLRVAAGTFMLQGHDPTTDLSFRNLRAVEIAPRRTE